MASIKFAQALLTNVAVTGAAIVMPAGGTYSFAVVGTFGGATVNLQILGPDGVTYIDIAGASFTANGVMSVDLPAGATVKAKITGGAPSGIYATLSLIRS
jgi:hypothetical protein